MKKQNIGSSFEDFLREDGIFEEINAAAIKRVLARQIEQAMAKEHLSKVEMARKMKTSRPALDRLLDPANDGVTLQTLSRAASVLGRRLSVELV